VPKGMHKSFIVIGILGAMEIVGRGEHTGVKSKRIYIVDNKNIH